MSNSASSSPIDGIPKGNALTQALHQSRSNQSSPVTGPPTSSSRFTDSPRSLYGSMSSNSAAGGASRDSPITTPRHNQNYTQSLRTNTNSTSTVTGPRDSPPNSAAALAMEKRKLAGGKGPDGPGMFRTSSMDSTLSSMSANTTMSQASAPTDGGPSSAEIAALIASAGSAENLIRQLLREKRNAAMHNNKLFKLLDRQKSIMQGMHVDLERALADKERYRNIASTLQVPITPEAPLQYRKLSPAISATSLPSSSSQDRLLSQRPTEAGSKKPVQEPASASSQASNSSAASERDGKRNTVVQLSASSAKPTHDDNKTGQAEGALSPRTPPRTPKSPDLQTDSSRTSFTARRSMTQRKESIQSTSYPASPTEIGATSPSARKAPPAPLVLAKPVESAPDSKSPEDYGPEDHTDSDYDELDEDDLPTFDRGRKKTREEDDLEREVMMLRVQRASQSAKKEKSTSKSSKKSQKLQAEEVPQTPSFKGISPPSSAGSQSKSAQAASIASILDNPANAKKDNISVPDRLTASPLKSPGLPLSPRPQDRPLNSALPRNIAEATPNIHPLSPRVLHESTISPVLSRQPAPAPTGPLPPPPMSAPLQSRNVGLHHGGPVPQSAALTPPNRATADRIDLSTEPTSGTIFHGFISDAYPDLLLPPNALPSILVRVTSSRLRPSRQSSHGPRGSTDESVFTLGIFARSNQKQLWRVEKAAVSLVSLEHQLKQVQPFDVKVPDRMLFSGHAPARVDARRVALEGFFETLLDTHMNEKAAIILCKYFSTQVIASEESGHQHGKESDGSIAEVPDRDTVAKEGYLTKKGKNFGGWKARFFILNDPILRYYESPGGSLLGTIKLTNAQIGRQSAHKSRSPTRTGEDDPDSQYRHAFLIMEPKRNNSSSQLQHVLCAENDTERDEWVEALMFYLGKEPEVQSAKEKERGKATPNRVETSRENKSLFQSKKKEKKERQSDASENPPEDALVGFSYGDARQGQAPTVVTSRSTIPRNTQTPPPPATSTATVSPGQGGRSISGPIDATPIGNSSAWGNRETPGISGPKNGTVITDATMWGNKEIISTPKNGAPIQDATQWGNKTAEKRPGPDLRAPESPRVTEKDTRKRSFWGFRNHSSHESTASATESITSVNVKPPSRPVFGMPLADAVEFCMASGSPTPLPAVVYRCLEYLEARGAEMEEGIFRISGSTLTINKLKDRFNTEGDVNLLSDDNYYDVHAVASLLKLYLRELPERVLTNALYPRFAAIQDLDGEQAKVKALNRLVHKLPLPNWTLVHSLCRFLIQVDSASEMSKMTIRNLCIVFAPTLNLSNPIISHFLKDFPRIFDTEPEGGAGDDGVGIEVTAPSPRVPDYIPTSQDLGESGLGLQYEEVLQLARGITDDSSSQNSGSTRHTGNATAAGATLGGPEYGAVKTHRVGPGLSAAAGGPKDMKQKRRESSMLMMNNFPAPGGGHAGNIHGNYQGLGLHTNITGTSSQSHSSPFSAPQRKSSLPLMRENQ